MRHLLILSVLASLALSSCASSPQPLPLEAANRDAGYRLAPGDKLRITVYNETALTGEYSINTAGNVAMPLIGDVPAKGDGVEKLTAAITAKLAGGYVKDPRVSVEVLNYRPYYILGEINKPGEFPYSVNLTVEQAVAAAGGFTYRANRTTAFVRRAEQAAEGRVALRGAPVYVKPGDTIRIGERYF